MITPARWCNFVLPGFSSGVPGKRGGFRVFLPDFTGRLLIRGFPVLLFFVLTGHFFKMPGLIVIGSRAWGTVGLFTRSFPQRDVWVFLGFHQTSHDGVQPCQLNTGSSPGVQFLPLGHPSSYTGICRTSPGSVGFSLSARYSHMGVPWSSAKNGQGTSKLASWLREIQ